MVSRRRHSNHSAFTEERKYDVGIFGALFSKRCRTSIVCYSMYAPTRLSRLVEALEILRKPTANDKRRRDNTSGTEFFIIFESFRNIRLFSVLRVLVTIANRPKNTKQSHSWHHTIHVYFCGVFHQGKGRDRNM